MKLWVECFEKAKRIGIARALDEALANRNKIIFMRRDILIGVSLSDIPSGLVSAPLHMKWDDVGKEQDLKFHAGIFALCQHPDGALEPRTGWAVVVDADANPVA